MKEFLHIRVQQFGLHNIIQISSCRSSCRTFNVGKDQHFIDILVHSDRHLTINSKVESHTEIVMNFSCLDFQLGFLSLILLLQSVHDFIDHWLTHWSDHEIINMQCNGALHPFNFFIEYTAIFRIRDITDRTECWFDFIIPQFCGLDTAIQRFI